MVGATTPNGGIGGSVDFKFTQQTSSDSFDALERNKAGKCARRGQ